MVTDALTLGSFLLTDPSGSAWKVGVEAEGTSKGAPVPIDVAVKSWLQNGSIVVTQGYDNRDVSVRIRMWATSLTALCNAEAALFAELGKPNLLTWTPTSGPAAVFVVITSSMVQDDQGGNADLLGSQRLIRSYNIRLTCEAFTRSATAFTSIGTAPGGSTTTSLDACAATTGWSATVDGVAGSVTNAAGPPTTIAVSSASVSGLHTLTLTKTFAATTSTTNLLMVDWLPTPRGGATLSAVGDGVSLPLFAEFPSPTSGYTRTWFKVSASSLAVTTFSLASGGPFTNVRTLRIDQVSVTNVQPVNGTNRQQTRSLTVPGSAPTPASLAIESATAALGDGVMVFVFPADDSTASYSPSMRQFRTSGNTVTPDAAQVSGNTEPLSASAVNFAVPIGLFPRGSYLLCGRLATSGGGTPTITYESKTNIGVLAVATSTGSRTITTTTAYQTFVLGRMQLPTIDLDPNADTAGVSMFLSLTATGTVTYDEFWLFNTAIGTLIRVDCGTGAGSAGGTSRRLWIDPPSVTTPRPTVRVGHAADRSDSHYPTTGFTSWQFPQWKPPQGNVLVVTPNATDAVVSLSGYARWHTNPAS